MPTPKRKAQKHDGGKLRYDLVPTEALADIVSVLSFGADKYGDRNWEQGLECSRLYAAVHRHLAAYWSGETFDKESGHPHLAHAGCGILMLLQAPRIPTAVDDRPRHIT